jgi:hypothetical protein
MKLRKLENNQLAALKSDEETILHVLPTISRIGGGVSEAARLLVLSLSQKLPGHVSVLTTYDPYSRIDSRAC